ncbi:MAG TPA: ATP-binding protein [Anaerolineaceae bacterium]
MTFELTPEQLRRIVDPASLECTDSTQMPVSKMIIGQERATRSLQFGLGIRATGFNIYVSGAPGTGRTTAVRQFLQEVARDKITPPDWCYVRDFHNASRPNAIRLPTGRAHAVKQEMKDLIDSVRVELRRVFESEEYAARRREAAGAFERQGEQILEQINRRAGEAGFSLQQTPMGLMTIPIKDGRPMKQEEFAALSGEEREALNKKQQALQEEIESAIRQARGIEKTAGEEVQRMDRQVAEYALNLQMTEMKSRSRDVPEVLEYLEQVRQDILDNLDQFRAAPETPPGNGNPQLAQQMAMMVSAERGAFFRRYEVNVLVDNGAVKGAPVVTELNPTYNNLFGRVEMEAQFGALVTDFTLIRNGSLHRANGGYLVIPVEEMLRNPFSWDGLKRALKNHQISIEDPSERAGLPVTRTLQPEPIPLDIKIVLIGQPGTYAMMELYDEDFRELFKVKADFDSTMDRDEQSVRDYLGFISAFCESENIKPVDCTGMARIVEYGSRLAEDQLKLTTRFGTIADIVREASYYAALDMSQFITGAHVEKAIEEKIYRSNLAQEKLQEMTRRGILMIQVDGERVGQVNGLAVMDIGDIAIGHPNRITASVGVGREGLVNIEREANLSGPIHTKGMLILSGFLIDRFAQDKPISLSARLVFEQSYSGVEGDSASSTELYALLSALAGLPVRQGIAVTGSVNQRGEVQAIGGVNEKVEGFYEVCKAAGLTGKQGVLIPAANVEHLMLKTEIVAAAREGKFHLWAVRSIDEGIEVLTGVSAGARDAKGKYPDGSVNARVDARLRELAEMNEKFGQRDEKSEDQPADSSD